MRKIIRNLLLCLRYPFLYPRNVFSGLHYNNYGVSEKAWKYKKESYDLLFTEIDGDGIPQKKFKKVGGVILKVEKEGINKIQIRAVLSEYTEKVLTEHEFDDEVLDCGWNENEDTLVVKTKSEDSKVSFLNIEVIVNKWKYFLSRLILFYHDWILQAFHFIPTFTWLDAFPKGWKDEFALDMCDELRDELLRSGGWKLLWRWRIHDLKEKYGTLRLYSNFETPGIEKIIDKYEDLSSKICRVCGKKATWVTQGYISFYCSDHVPDEYKKEEI